MTTMDTGSSPTSKALIHEWTKAQVASAAKPNYGKIFVTAPNLLEMLGEVQGKKVLEMGCGNGYWLRLLARDGADCTGIDLSENQIEVAKK
jgi:2-polyprenyl-3-methyl-5-hydroxy-6-metoxy-1,4-benzoquinol methylase